MSVGISTAIAIGVTAAGYFGARAQAGAFERTQESALTAEERAFEQNLAFQERQLEETIRQNDLDRALQEQELARQAPFDEARLTALDQLLGGGGSGAAVPPGTTPGANPLTQGPVYSPPPMASPLSSFSGLG